MGESWAISKQHFRNMFNSFVDRSIQYKGFAHPDWTSNWTDYGSLAAKWQVGEPDPAVYIRPCGTLLVEQADKHNIHSIIFVDDTIHHRISRGRDSRWYWTHDLTDFYYRAATDDGWTLSRSYSLTHWYVSVSRDKDVGTDNGQLGDSPDLELKWYAPPRADAGRDGERLQDPSRCWDITKSEPIDIWRYTHNEWDVENMFCSIKSPHNIDKGRPAPSRTTPGIGHSLNK